MNTGKFKAYLETSDSQYCITEHEGVNENLERWKNWVCPRDNVLAIAVQENGMVFPHIFKLQRAFRRVTVKMTDCLSDFFLSHVKARFILSLLMFAFLHKKTNPIGFEYAFCSLPSQRLFSLLLYLLWQKKKFLFLETVLRSYGLEQSSPNFFWSHNSISNFLSMHPIYVYLFITLYIYTCIYMYY